MTMEHFRKMPLKRKPKKALLYLLMPFAFVIDSVFAVCKALRTKKKAVVSCALVLAVLTAMPLSGTIVLAEDTNTPSVQAEIPESGISGSGTSDDPYLIADAEGLLEFRGKVDNGQTGVCGKFTADIDLNPGFSYTENAGGTITVAEGTWQPWTPIGENTAPYAGTFDGGGHTVSGLYFND